MKINRIFITGSIAGAMLLSSCLGDLDTLPLNESDSTSETAYGNEEGSYIAGLTKIYWNFANTSDLDVDDGGASELVRAFWSLQELSADAAKCAWGDSWVSDINNNRWSDADNAATYGVYARSLQGVAFVNEFLRQTAPDKLSARGVSSELAAKIEGFRDEARFARAYFYWIALDIFGNVPFTTEELWGAFGYAREIIGRSEWPTLKRVDGGEAAKTGMETIQAVVRAMRNLRAEIKMPPQQTAPKMCIKVKRCEDSAALSENEDLVRLLAKVEAIDFLPADAPKPPKSISTVTSEWELYFPIGELLDTDKEIARLEAEFAKLEKEAQKISAKLANKNFVDRAPADVVEKERAALESAETQMARIKENIAGLK